MEIAKLTGLSANSVINHTKSIFARYGIPETVVSDMALNIALVALNTHKGMGKLRGY